MSRVEEVDRIVRSCTCTQFKWTVGSWKNKIGPTHSMDKHCISCMGGNACRFMCVNMIMLIIRLKSTITYISHTKILYANYIMIELIDILNHISRLENIETNMPCSCKMEVYKQIKSSIAPTPKVSYKTYSSTL